MRQMNRNQRPVWYSHPGETDYVLDENGEATTELYQKWSEPQRIMCNVSGGVGEWAVQSFGGTFVGYSRTISLTGECPLSVGDRLWVDRDSTAPFNYIVVAVNSGLAECLVAIREVPTSAT